jgi:hypothetical protein
MIKAIETKYKGYRFRSRLEARWAVFFDALGIEWTYEPQGFEKGGTRYLPDFQIHLGRDPFKVPYWVEVKGDKNWLYDNRVEIDELHDWGGILPNFANCGDQNRVAGGLIVLGDIPEPEFGMLFLPVIGHSKGVNLYWRCLADAGYGLANYDQIFSIFFDLNADHYCVACLNRTTSDFTPRIAKTPRANPKIKDALIAARSARFEHGETPMAVRQ